MNMLDEALKDLDKAIEYNKSYTKAYIKKGDIFLQKEEYEEAVREYSKAKDIEPSF
jgi:tetratricopeptide (TPR) repeat protein